MRTTVTLDPDVESMLHKEVRRCGEPFKQVLNNVIRAGPRNMKRHDKAFEPLTSTWASRAPTSPRPARSPPSWRTPSFSLDIGADVNTLLHAVNRSRDQYTTALGALRQGFDDPRGVAFA
jgi:hypothetical protein